MKGVPTRVDTKQQAVDRNASQPLSQKTLLPAATRDASEDAKKHLQLNRSLTNCPSAQWTSEREEGVSEREGERERERDETTSMCA